MTVINVVNKSTLVSNADVQTMTRAVASQIKLHLCPLWGRLPVPVTYLSNEADAQPGSWVLFVLDDADQQDALGYHDETDAGVIYGRVFARPVLNAGGDALTKSLSVASVLSHEVCEIVVDPTCNLYADMGIGKAVAFESADPVENDSYVVSVAKKKVTVSNFVLPAWFDPRNRSGPFDYLGNLKHPLTMSKGGYMIIEQEGKVSQVFGRSYAKWRKESKKSDLSRTSRRIN